MYFTDVVELGNMCGDKNNEGFPINRFVKTKTVYADKRSVSRASFYAASAAGRALKCVFVIRAEDYDGETAVRYNDHIFDVVRPYQKDGSHDWELECTDESVAQDET